MLGKPQLLITPCGGPNLNIAIELEASSAHYSCRVSCNVMVCWLALALDRQGAVPLGFFHPRVRTMGSMSILFMPLLSHLFIPLLSQYSHSQKSTQLV